MNCGDFVRWIVTILFGELWRIYSVNCGGFVRWIVENQFGGIHNAAQSPQICGDWHHFSQQWLAEEEVGDEDCRH